MRVFRDASHGQWEKDLAAFSIGALGGLAVGVLLSRLLPSSRSLSEELRSHARGVSRRLRPMRLRRGVGEQDEMDGMEGSVLEGLLEDSVLRDRGIDVGAISPGIIELSGSVRTQEEAERAVALANRTGGVRTVVNRLDIEEHSQRLRGARRSLDPEDLEATFGHQEGRVGGMGRRRQGGQTEPDRPDDSQHMRENALAAADRQQWEDEGLVGRDSRSEGRPEGQEGPTRYTEAEMDNQDPHGKHARLTLDSPPEELNSAARVGEPPKAGTRLRLERSDVKTEETPAKDRED